MSTGQFMIAKGRIIEAGLQAINDATNNALKLDLYKTVPVDTATLQSYTTRTQINANLTICDFDNYATKTVAGLARTEDGSEVMLDANDTIWTSAGSAGGGVNNLILLAVLYWDPDVAGGIADWIPLAHYDFIVTTVGVDLKFEVPVSGLYRTG